MKYYLSGIIGIFLLSAVLVSCKKDFLEVKPKGRMIATTLQDYDLLMNGTDFYSVYGGIPGAIMGDEVAAEEAIFQNSSLISQRSFAWADLVYPPAESPRYLQIQ